MAIFHFTSYAKRQKGWFSWAGCLAAAINRASGVAILSFESNYTLLLIKLCRCAFAWRTTYWAPQRHFSDAIAATLAIRGDCISTSDSRAS